MDQCPASQSKLEANGKEGYMKPIQKNICALRKAFGLSQTDLGKKLNLPMKRIASYEQGRAMPTIDSVVKLSDEFNVSIDKLVRTELTIIIK